MILQIGRSSFTFYAYSKYSFKLTSHWRDFYANHFDYQNSITQIHTLNLNKRYRLSLGNLQFFFKICGILYDEGLNFCWFTTLADEYIILTVLILFSGRALTGSFSTYYHESLYLQIRMGSFFSAVGVKPFHMEFLCFLWAANYMTYILIPCLFKLKHFNWAFIVLWTEKKISNQSIGKVLYTTF